MTTTEKAICQASNANTTPCTKEATKTIHWPGRSLVMCDEHANAAKKVADAMGFDLTIALLGLALALFVIGCGPDSFFSIADVDATDGGQASPESSTDAEQSKLDAGADAVVEDVEASADASGDDSGEACPMVGASCSPLGARKCRGVQTVWYCGGTWTSNACTQGNPACSPCDAGFCCTIGPICP